MKIIMTFLFLYLWVNGADLYKRGNLVIDKKNNLIWQDEVINTTLLKSQMGASEYCESLQLAGLNKWRLPSRDEYKTIIDKSRLSEELTIKRAFKNVLSDHYWTSDRTWRNFFRWGYFIYFKSGTFYYENKTYPKYVRCVRDLK